MKTTIAQLGPEVTIDEVCGYLFDAARGRGICFVPEFCLQPRIAGGFEFDSAAYVMGGWPRTNGLFNMDVVGHRMFPNLSAPVRDLSAESAQAFLERTALFQLA